MATSKEMTAGPALPLILKFTLPLLLGNLLQQTYSLVDAAIVGKFLGINALASVGASTSVVFLDSRVLQWMLRRFRNTRCAEVWGAGLQYDAQLCGRQSETGCGNVCGDCSCYQSLYVRTFSGSCARRRIFSKELMLICL